MRSVRVTTRETGTVRGTTRRPHVSLAIISVTVQLGIQVFWVISVYFNVRNILPKSGTFPPGHPVYVRKLRCIVPVPYNCTTFLDNFPIHMAKSAETCSFFRFAKMKFVYRHYSVLYKHNRAVAPQDTNYHLLHRQWSRFRFHDSPHTQKMGHTKQKTQHIIDSGINHFFTTENSVKTPLE